MRLLEVSESDNAETLPRLVDFSPDRIPPYAILSHRWNASPSQEILFSDLIQSGGHATSSLRYKAGYTKFQSSCAQARKHGLDYLWIDTCCIDKSSSAELSEAINTMFTWYSRAIVCFAYLADVPSTVDISSDDSEFTRTEWATRGWTLQELLASREIVFFSGDWHTIGTKDSLSSILSITTGIEEKYLTNESLKLIWSASVAKRMSWAARRNTSRPEDIAYCLMGLFQVNMPMLYGEGENAFVRLQEEIMKHSDDHSLFAWTDQEQDEGDGHGLLAKHPRCFTHSGSIVPYEDRESRATFSMSNRGLCIELHLTKLAGESMYAAALDCPVPPDYPDSSFLAIYLKKLPFNQSQFARVKIGSFGRTDQRGSLQTIYVRQSIIVPDIQGIFPSHRLQLRKFVMLDAEYRVARTIALNTPKSSEDSVRAVTTTRITTTRVPLGDPITCLIPSKGDTRACFAVHIVFEEIESIVILLGTTNMQVGWNLVQTESAELNIVDLTSLMTADFVPSPLNSTKVVGYHRVRVTAEPLVSRGSKYYMIDIDVDALERPRGTIEEVLGAIDAFVTPGPTLPIQNRRTVRQILSKPFGVKRIG